ncbi:MAG: glycosyltransferase family 2 protein [Candidatus Methanomethylicia archaeon]
MEWPLVTVITVNYNSLRFISIVSESIKSILGLDYSPLEVIIVDNGSTDGSFEFIKTIARRLSPSNVKVRFLKLSKNYGFAAANNIAFEKRDKRAKYVALINNDLVPSMNSLRELINFLESNDEVAGVQGKILDWNGSSIDSAGCYITQYGNVYCIGQTLPSNSCNQSINVSFIENAYSVYRVEPILKCGGLFLPFLFMYSEDYELGIRLWRNGYRLMYIPVIAGRHYRSATSKKSTINLPLEYWIYRSEFTVITMYDELWLIHILLRIPMILLRSLLEHNKSIMRGLIDGIYIGLRSRVNVKYFKFRSKTQPRIKMSIFRWYLLLIRLFMLYGTNVHRILRVLMSRYLGCLSEHQQNNFISQYM